MTDKRIAPSILSSNFSDLGSQVKLVEDAGAHMIHVDVMDGHFVPNITIGPVVVDWIRKSSALPFDVHLMIENADTYIPAFVKAGANLISVHYEASKHLNRTLQLIHSHNCQAGIVLNPATPVEVLQDSLGEFDFVLLMSVNPGFGGQKFIRNTFSKIERAVKMRAESSAGFAIEVDGGITMENLRDVMKAGADWIVAGSSIYDGKDPSANVRQMNQVLQEF